ncbi:MAG: dihydroneopterin aldolase [Proteobacteria bacterium]|nr:dihydroneopterin aldolase [Pseudomonadota bacterium]
MTGNDPKTIAAARTRAPSVAAAPEIAATAQRILLSDLTLPCRIGVTEEERAQRQRLRFNIQLEIRPEPPREDKITEVVDYGPLVARIRNVCAEAEFRLLESLAGRIAQACFFDARVVSARVRIEKLDLYPDAGGVGCEFEYCRARSRT